MALETPNSYKRQTLHSYGHSQYLADLVLLNTSIRTNIAGSATSQTGYGIVTFTLAPPGRVSRKQDQKGDTCTFNYDLAGRLSDRQYRTAANSPSGTIADSDQFTHDRAGRMLTAISGRYNNTVGYAYDSKGRKKTESWHFSLIAGTLLHTVSLDN